jgi:hypothetical protein
MNRRRLLLPASALLALACGGKKLIEQAYLSPLPSHPGPAALAAGFGRVDIRRRRRRPSGNGLVRPRGTG